MPESRAVNLKTMLASEALDARRRTHFRLVRPDDAAFILALRVNPALREYLTAVEDDVKAQRQWIEQYIEREQRGREFYFLIVHDGQPIGTVRMYDFLAEGRLSSFSWGSWIIKTPRPKGVVDVSLCLIYRLGFSTLNFNRSHFKVDLKNTRVLNLHTRSGAEQTADLDGDLNFFFWPEELDRLWVRHKEALIEHGQH